MIAVIIGTAGGVFIGWAAAALCIAGHDCEGCQRRDDEIDRLRRVIREMARLEAADEAELAEAATGYRQRD